METSKVEMAAHGLNFTASDRTVQVPSISIVSVSPSLSNKRLGYHTTSCVENKSVGNANGVGDQDQESNDEFSEFLKIYEEKVILEIGSNGGLVISPSVAARLNSIEKLDKNGLETIQEEKKGWKKYAGIIFGLSASFFFSLTVVMVKILSQYHPFNISVWRYCGIFIPSIPMFLFYHYRCPKDKRTNVCKAVLPLNEKKQIHNFLGLMLRGLLGCTSVLFRFVSLKYLTVADSSVISYSGPVFIVIVAHFCLGEKCGFVSIVVAVLTTFGVFIIVRPPIFTGEASFDTNTLIGTSLALMSMICNSTVTILMRKIRKVHYVLMLLTFGTWGVAESLFVATSFGVLELPQGLHDSLLLLGVLPVLVFFGQISIILALKFEAAGPVSLVRTCDVIFSFIWQFVFLSVSPDIFSLVGATVVILSVCITVFRKWLTTLPKNHSARIKFKIFLM